MFHTSFFKALKKQALYVTLVGAVIVPLSACDLAKNYTKADRSGDMDVQDYRDAMAQRLPDISKNEDAGIPELKPYMATPSDKMKAMPLVSVSVNQTVPLKDVLYELGEQANYDIELDPRIRGSIIFTATNKPFDQVIDKISESSGLRYKFEDDSVKIELDTPYSEIYKINYLNYVRSNTSSISNDVAVVSGEGADTGSKFKAEAKSEADFWAELDTNLKQIIGVNRDAGTMRTSKDPRISAVSEEPAPVSNVAPVEPVVLTADGEIAQGGQNANVQVQAPDAVLRVEPLPVDDEETGTAGEDPFAGRFSVNKQAGIISVFATERLQKQIAKYLDVLKKSVSSQVLIEAKVLEVSLTDEFAAGIDWRRLNTSPGGLSIGSVSNTGSVAPGFDPISSPAIGFFASYLSDDFQTTVEALSRFGTVHALASPRLTVLNNQSAVLNVATNVVYFELDVDVTTVEGSSSTTVDSQIRNVPEGILINVQPSIDLDSETISMAVRPTVTRIARYVNDPAVSFLDAGIESPVPVVNVQEFDSVIKMNNGRPIILGGLIQDRSTSEQNGVPVLGEIPVVGGLFRNQGDKIQKTELVVILKATIVEGDNTIHQTDKDMYRTFSQDRRPFDL